MLAEEKQPNREGITWNSQVNLLPAKPSLQMQRACEAGLDRTLLETGQGASKTGTTCWILPRRYSVWFRCCQLTCHNFIFSSEEGVASF